MHRRHARPRNALPNHLAGIPARIGKWAIWAVLACPVLAPAQALKPDQQQLRAIYQELVEINTTDSVGDTTQATRAMAAHLRAGGFAETDLHIIVPPGAPKRATWSRALRATAAASNPCCSWRMWTWWRPSGKTGSAIRSS